MLRLLLRIVQADVPRTLWPKGITVLGPPKCHVEGKNRKITHLSFAPVFELRRKYVWILKALCHEGPKITGRSDVKPLGSSFNYLGCHSFVGNLARYTSMMLWHVDRTSKYASQILHGSSLLRHAFIRVTCGRKLKRLMQEKLMWLPSAGEPFGSATHSTHSQRQWLWCPLFLHAGQALLFSIRPGWSSTWHNNHRVFSVRFATEFSRLGPKRAGWMPPPSKPPKVSPALSMGRKISKLGRQWDSWRFPPVNPWFPLGITNLEKIEVSHLGNHQLAVGSFHLKHIQFIE